LCPSTDYYCGPLAGAGAPASHTTPASVVAAGIASAHCGSSPHVAIPTGLLNAAVPYGVRFE
jgi:hypothetical protein